MAYYLMEVNDASTVWQQRMDAYGVKDTPKSCRTGRPDAVYYTGGPEADGCYLNGDGRANLRYVAAATKCRQLMAGATRLKRPAIYIAVLGPDSNLAKLTEWAEPTAFAGSEALTQPIKRPKEAWSELCPT